MEGETLKILLNPPQGIHKMHFKPLTISFFLKQCFNTVQNIYYMEVNTKSVTFKTQVFMKSNGKGQ